MPELPDIQVFCRNINKLFGGKKLSKLKVVNGKKLKDTSANLSKTLQGKILKDVYRSGKEMRFKFSGNQILGIHLMLTGDLIPFEEINPRKTTIVEFYFSNKKNLALTDRMGNAFVKLNPEEKKGIDALDKGLNYKYLKEMLNRKANIKNILLDQNVIRGIGNAYSDEILWQCRISPFSIAKAIPDDKIKELAKKIKTVLTGAEKKIAKTHPGLIYGEVRDFLEIHTKNKTASPGGAAIKTVQRGMLKTYFTDEQILYK